MTVVEDEAVRMLLDGLNVESLTDLKRLVDDGRYYRFMLGEGFRLSSLRESRDARPDDDGV